MAAQSRLWGAVMAGGGALLGLICLLWTFSTAGTSGGRLFGLAFVIILALPLIAGGVFLFRRGAQEELQEQQITSQRRVLESETLSRTQLADRAGRARDRLQSVLQAALPSGDPTSRLLLEDAVARLNGVQSALSRTAYDRVGAFEAVAADPTDRDTVRSIDAAVESSLNTLDGQLTELTSSLASGRPDPAVLARIGGAIARIENAVNQRSNALTSGEEKPLPTVDELLRGIQPSGAQEPQRFTELKPNDAVSLDGEDVLVTGRVEWRDGERAWYTYLLSGGESERWLLVESGGTRLASMEPAQLPAPNPDGSVTVGGASWPLTNRGTAAVTVTGAAGIRGGLFVGYRRYDGPDGFLWVEDWDEGTKAMLGTPERAENVELWIR